ncbi:MAG: DUF2130 domain-containing protein [Termitinemataceae bacterium]|nr:MAG: DUF2130 domain-containing protein [Termitinemataceae bacterium]
MTNNNITCPFCHKEFQLTEAITNQIEGQLKFDMEKALSDKYEKQYEKRYEEDYKKLKESAAEKAKKEFNNELKDKEEELQEMNKKLQSFKEKEKIILQKERALEEERHTIEIAYQEKLNKEVKMAYSKAQESLEKEYDLKIKEKEKLIADLNKQMKEGQKKAEQGSMQLQGEILEIKIEELLRINFPQDIIEPVPVGIRGADIIQTVKLDTGKSAGKIIWELKRTKNFSMDWIDKLKEDQKSVHAEIAIIATEALPQEIAYFGTIENVWITDVKYILGVAKTLRENLTALAKFKYANEGKENTSGMIFNYLIGTEFKLRVESILKAYVDMQNDLEQEKRILEKSWAKREQQIKLFFKNISGMYGDLQGIGAPLQEVKLLEG